MGNSTKNRPSPSGQEGTLIGGPTDDTAPAQLHLIGGPTDGTAPAQLHLSAAKKLKVFVTGGLSAVDLISDLYMIYTYATTPGQQGTALSLAIMVVLCLLFQLVLVHLQHHRGPRHTMIKEMLIALSGTKPGVDAWRVAKGVEKTITQSFSPEVELVGTKVIEMFCESIPGTVLQAGALVSGMKENGGAFSEVALGSIVVSALTTGFGSAMLSFAFDISPDGRSGYPGFYGYIPDSAGKRAAIFICLTMNSALLLILRSVSTVLLLRVDGRLVLCYYLGEHAVYMAYKIARGDFWYWIPVPGAFQETVISVFARVSIKAVNDFTGVVQFRHPGELGGAVWTLSQMMALVASAVATHVYLSSEETDPDGKAMSASVAWMVVGGLGGSWMLGFACFLLLMKRGYRGTFLSTMTSCAEIERYFLEFEEDENKAKVFSASGKKWASIRPDVKAWTLENWERWEEDAPEWFSDHFRAAVDDDMIPPASLARLKGGGGGERRRSSLGDLLGASAKVLPVIKFYGAGVGRGARSNSLALPRVSNPSQSGGLISGGNLLEDGLGPARRPQPAAAAPDPPAPCLQCRSQQLRVDKLLAGERQLMSRVAALSASEGALRKRAAGAERELGEAAAAAAEKEGQMLALEAERERAVRGRDEAETELLRLIEANERLQARIKVRPGAALREGGVRVDVSDRMDLLRGQLGDERTSHELTKNRLNGIITDLRSEMEAVSTRTTQKNSEMTRMARELSKLQEASAERERNKRQHSTSGTQVSPKREPAPAVYEKQEKSSKSAGTQAGGGVSGGGGGGGGGDSKETLRLSLTKLEAAVLAEIKGMQRHAHLLNLTNTSTMREMKLELDSHKLRLEAAKEQQNVLLFCLQTAETKLSEVDPETAEKVRSSRGVRMKSIKESLGGKMMQLEQRSGSTSFMTGEKLRELLPKAKETWDEWLTQRKNLFEDLKNQLGGEMFGIGKKGGQKFDMKDKQTHLVAKPAAAAAEPPKPKKKSAAELAAEDVDEEEELDEAEASVFKIALAATLVYVTIGVVSFYFIYKPVGWGFSEAFYYTIVTLTTVGYGDINGASAMSQGEIFFTAIYALFGILLAGTALGIIAAAFVEAQEEAMQATLQAALEADTDKDGKRRASSFGAAVGAVGGVFDPIKKLYAAVVPEDLQALMPSFGILGFMIGLGMILAYADNNDLTGTEAFYFAVITSTTIGYGDISPINHDSTMILGAIYLLVTVTATGNVLGSIAGFFIDKKKREAMEKILQKKITIKDFAKFDVDGDGKIEKSEFVINKLVLMGLVQQVDIDRVEQEFAVMDADGSGEIDMEDLHAYLKEANAKKAAAKGGKPAAVVQEAPAPAAVVQETPDNKV
ncbi:hypothetical protein TeGR_g7304 [Tetraparma gracilis]|uniref:EF-hand domain-containing protein n=1 Tax=Tetraparma gracilis TaxID=2962635 RepID=A0ABQ6MSM0_9STRA|nr:hypothetical protein TeGR_g7304 [Tetraparma gracilis]